MSNSLGRLSPVIRSESSRCLFACGGQLDVGRLDKDIGAEHAASSEQNTDARSLKTVVDHVSLRFGPDGQGRLLSLPVSETDEAFQSLVETCTPASFGLGGKDVLDESYRKASKLDTTEFSTSFCPYSSGIIDIVNQLLIPSFGEERSIRAELYKLNVYSGPSEKFKPHVDTPRGATQVGSLVVALPSKFQGKR